MQHSTTRLSKINTLFLVIVTITLLLVKLSFSDVTTLGYFSTVSNYGIAYFPYLFCLYFFGCLFASKSVFEWVEIIKICAITLCFISFYLLVLNWVLSDWPAVNNDFLYLFFSVLWGLAAFILLPFIQIYLVLGNFRFDYAKLAFFAWQNSIALILVLPILLLLNLFVQIVVVLLRYFQLDLSDYYKDFSLLIHILLLSISLSAWVVKFFKKQVDSLINIFYVIADSLLAIICFVVFAYGFYVLKGVFSHEVSFLVHSNIGIVIVLGWCFLIASQSILSCDLKNNERLRSIFKHRLFVYAISVLLVLILYLILQIIIIPSQELSEWIYWLLIQFACFSAYIIAYFIAVLPFLKINLQQTFYYRFKGTDTSTSYRFKRVYLLTWQRYHPKLNIEKINIYFALVFILLLIGLSTQITTIQNHVFRQAAAKLYQEDKALVEFDFYEYPDIPDFNMDKFVLFTIGEYQNVDSDFTNKLNELYQKAKIYKSKSDYSRDKSANEVREAILTRPISELFVYISPSVKLLDDQIRQLKLDVYKQYQTNCLSDLGTSVGEKNYFYNSCGLLARYLNRDDPDKVTYILITINVVTLGSDFTYIQFNEETDKYEVLNNIEFGDDHNVLMGLTESDKANIHQLIDDKLQVHDSEVNTIQIDNKQIYLIISDDK